MARRRADDRSGCWAATSQREREGERGLVGARGRHSARGRGTVPCARQREVDEDALNDGGVVDGGDRSHAAGLPRGVRVSSTGRLQPRCYQYVRHPADPGTLGLMPERHCSVGLDRPGSSWIQGEQNF